MTESDLPPTLSFYGGLAGALVPLVAFLAGVIALGLSGAPDERGFWPILIAALALALALARDPHAYAETMIRGMSQPIVMLMVVAWMLAGILAALMKASGFVEALVWVAGKAGVAGGGYVAASFLICCAVSTSTGTSLGTLLLTTPLLYPAGGALGAEPVVLVGAILGGATFGDNVSPISDTTIASAATQGADLGGVVRSRMRYALPAAALALGAAALLGGADGGAPAGAVAASSPRGLPMLLAPALVLVLLLRRRHLVEGLMAGIVAAAAVALGFRLILPGDVLYVDAERFSARGLVVDGIEGSVGIVVFTLLLMGLLAVIVFAVVTGFGRRC